MLAMLVFITRLGGHDLVEEAPVAVGARTHRRQHLGYDPTVIARQPLPGVVLLAHLLLGFLLARDVEHGALRPVSDL